MTCNTIANLSEKSLQALCIRLASALSERNIKLATAESCSGGWIAKVCTDMPGSSAWFSAALVTYSNEAKESVLGVNKTTLREYGAVSSAVVEEMLKQTLLKIPTAGIAIAVSGIAGPDGGSAEKPIGTVWIGWQLQGQLPRIQRFGFNGSRHAIRLATVAQAIQGALQLLNES